MFRPATYEPGKGCRKKTSFSQRRVLGKLDDGWWEVEVVKTSPAPHRQVEVVLKHGSHLHVEVMTQNQMAMLQAATGFSRPQGGVAVVHIEEGIMIDIEERRDGKNQEEESLEHLEPEDLS